MRFLPILAALAVPAGALAAEPPLPIKDSSTLHANAAQLQPVCSRGRVAYQSTEFGHFNGFADILPFGPSSTPTALYGGGPSVIRSLGIWEDAIVAGYEWAATAYQKFWAWDRFRRPIGGEWVAGDEHTVGGSRITYAPQIRQTGMELIKDPKGVAWKIRYIRCGTCGMSAPDYLDTWVGSQEPGIDVVDPEMSGTRVAWAEKIDSSVVGFMVKVTEDDDFSGREVGIGRHPSLDGDRLAYESWDEDTPTIKFVDGGNQPTVVPELPKSCAGFRFPRLGLDGLGVIYAGIDCDEGRQVLYFTNIDSKRTFFVDLIPSQIRDLDNPPYDMDEDGNIVYSKWVGQYGQDDYELFHVVVDVNATR